MIIHWGLPNVITGYAGQKNNTDALVSYRFLPGNNEIPDEKWEGIKKHPLIKNYLDDGTITEIAQQGEASGLKALKDAEARKVIKETFDHRLLETWQKDETRQPIQKAIEVQLKTIEEKTKKEKKDEESDDE